MPEKTVDALRAALGHLYLQSQLCECRRQRPDDRLFVVDNENSARAEYLVSKHLLWIN